MSESDFRFSNDNPYLALKAYEEENSSVFDGREEDKKELLKIVKKSTLTILYGKSGTGKSSLLQAGLFPLLRKEHYLPISIRIPFEGNINIFINQIISELKDTGFKIMFEEHGELYEGTVIQQNSTEEACSVKLENNTLWRLSSLWEFFHRVHIYDEEHEYIPVLVLDQFEDLFIRGRYSSIYDELDDQLIDLIENYIPEDVQHIYESQNKPIPYNYQQQNFKIIISFREDYYANVKDYLNNIPSIESGHYRINIFNSRQAREAIQGPEKGGKGGTEKAFKSKIFDESTVDEIINYFQPFDQQIPQDKLEIEPAILSLICFQLYENKNQLTPDNTLKSKDQKQKIVEDYYKSLIKNFPPEVIDILEDNLITNEGYRRPYPIPDDHPYKDDFLKLENQRLVRAVDYAGRKYIELIHDVLGPVVKKHKDKREAEEQQEREKAELREKIEEEKREKEEREKNLQREQKLRIKLANRIKTLYVVLGLLICAILFGIMQYKEAKEAAEAEKEARLVADQKTEEAEEAAYAKDLALQAEEKARLVAEKAAGAEKEARLVADQKTREAEEAAYAKDLALQAEEKARLVAEKAAGAEKEARLVADQKTREAETLQYNTLATNLAFQVELEEDWDHKKYLALTAYFLNKIYSDNSWNSEIVRALLLSDSLNYRKIVPITHNNQISPVLDIVETDQHIVLITARGELLYWDQNTDATKLLWEDPNFYYKKNSAIYAGNQTVRMEDLWGGVYNFICNKDTCIRNLSEENMGVNIGYPFEFAANQMEVVLVQNPDRKMFAAGTQDGWLYYKDTSNNFEFEGQFHDKNSRISDIVFDSHSQYIATAGLDGKIKLNAVSDLAEKHSVELKFNTWVNCLLFLPNKELMMGTQKGVLVIYSYDQDTLAKMVCAFLDPLLIKEDLEKRISDDIPKSIADSLAACLGSKIQSK